MKICKHKHHKLEECSIYHSDEGFPICGTFKDSSKVPKCFEDIKNSSANKKVKK